MGGENCGERSFLDLPEDTIANIFSFTSPRDTCRLSTVSLEFRDLLQSDAVWSRFLPSDFPSVISQCPDASLLKRFSLKKQLYLSLCDNPIIIDHGRKSFAMEKASGKKTYMIGARDLKIVWGDNPTCWRWSLTTESRFGEIAELLGVRWFEINGKINSQILSPATMYEAYFVYKSSGSYRLEHQPVEVTIRLVGTEGNKFTVYLKEEKGGARRRLQQLMRSDFFGRSKIELEDNSKGDEEVDYPRVREDGWIEVKLGEFFNKGGRNGELEINIMEVKGDFLKLGIFVQGIEIRPIKL
ncbi:F-box family protein [Euphorbia peplus]|nr:F-box family protein [Euphorbia peplus]